MPILILILALVLNASATQHNGVTLINDLPDSQTGWAGVTTYWVDGDGTVYSSQVDYEVPAGGSVEIDPQALLASTEGNSIIAMQMSFNSAYIELYSPFDTFFDLPMSLLPELVDPATGAGSYTFEAFKSAVNALLNSSAPDPLEIATGASSSFNLAAGIMLSIVLFFIVVRLAKRVT